MFSKACEYAIKSMIYIESNAGDSRKISLNEIAEAIDSPIAFTAKVLQQLKRKELLISTIGAKGGFEIKKGKTILLQQIVVAIDGDDFFNHCVLGLKVCSEENPCPVHHAYKAIKKDIIKNMLEIELHDFSRKIKNKSISLK